MQINVVINQVIILFDSFCRVYARKLNVITADMPGKLSNLILRVTLPLQILT